MYSADSQEQFICSADSRDQSYPMVNESPTDFLGTCTTTVSLNHLGKQNEESKVSVCKV
jgi:hypothetical protein